MLWVLFFGGFITHLPCHVVTFQSAVHVCYVVLKYNTGADIREVIWLGISTMFTFTSYYEPSIPLWEVVANSVSYFWQFRHHQKGCISVAVHSLLPA